MEQEIDDGFVEEENIKHLLSSHKNSLMIIETSDDDIHHLYRLRKKVIHVILKEITIFHGLAYFLTIHLVLNGYRIIFGTMQADAEEELDTSAHLMDDFLHYFSAYWLNRILVWNVYELNDNRTNNAV